MKTTTTQLLWLPIALLLLGLSQLKAETHSENASLRQAEETVTVEVSYGYDSGGTATIFDKTLNQELVLTENKTQVIKGHQIVVNATGKEGRTFYSGQWWPTGKSERNPIKALPLELTADVNLSVSLTFQYLASYSIRGEAGGTLKGYFLYKTDPDAWFPDEVPFNSPKRFFLDDNDTFVFKAQPSEGYKLKAWYLNGELVQGKSELTYKVVQPRTSINVEVEFSKEVAEAKVTMVQPDAAQGTMTAHYTDDATKAVTDGMSVEKGAQVTFVVAPNESYEMESWKVNEETKALESADPNQLTLTIEGDLKVEPILKESTPPQPTMYTVTLGEWSNAKGFFYAYYGSEMTKVENGASLPAGTEVSFAVDAAEDYELDYWMVDDVKSEDTSNPLVITLSKNIKVVPVMKEKVAPQPTDARITMIQPKAEEGTMTASYYDDEELETIDVFDGSRVNLGMNVTFVVAPKEGYEMDYWMVDDERQDLDTETPNKTIITITGDLKVEPILKKQAPVNPTEGTITIKSEGIAGHITASYKNPDSGNPMNIIPNRPKTLPNGTEVTIKATITAAGYEVTYTKNGDPVPAEALSADGMVYTFTVNGDATVVATFAQKQVTGEFTVTCIADPEEGGEVSASTAEGPITNETKVAGGEIVTVTATPKENFEVDQWFLNDKELEDIKGQSSYNFALTENVTIKVTFKSTLPPAEYAVTVEPVLPSAEAGDVKLFQKNGTPFESGKSVVEGTEMYVEVTPADKYELEMLQVGETKLPAGDEKLVNIAGGGVKYTFSVTAATKVQATFKLVNAIEQLAQSGVAAFVTNGGTRLEVAGAAEGAEVRLYDYTGQLLLTSTEHALDISALPAGSYIVLVGNYTTRIVK